MQLLKNMSVNEAIKIYYEKHNAIKEGNLNKLLEIKKVCPDIFDDEADTMIRSILDYFKEIHESDRYKKLCIMMMEQIISHTHN